jgi:hypothetical protein
MRNYVINSDRTVHLMEDLTEWARRQDHDNRIVTQEKVGDIMVSTVFLGIDHNHSGRGAPILFETMVFGGPLDERGWRCSTYAQAQEQHGAVVAKVKETMT